MENDQMSSKTSQKGLIAAIVFATLVVSGSLVFLGIQMNNSKTASNTQAQMADLLAQYKQTGVQLPPKITASTSELMDNDAVMGNKDSKVALIEFSDYQCPFCLRHYTQTMPLLRKNYIDTGKIKYVFRDFFAVPAHTNAVPSAIAAECARQQQGDAIYFQMGQKLFNSQDKMYDEGDNYPKNFVTFASELGLDTAKFSTCMNDPNVKAEVLADSDAGSKYGVEGTPGFVVTNGQTSQLISGAQPYSVFSKALDAMLQ